MQSSETGCQSFMSHSKRAGLILDHHESAPGEEKPFSHINVSSLSIALHFQQLQPCPAALASTDCLYLQTDVLRMPLASARITCATHRQKAANSTHPHGLGFATLYTYHDKGKNTHLETALWFLQLHHIIFALFLYSLSFILFNQIGFASPQQMGFVVSEIHEAERDEVSSIQRTRLSPAHAATLGLSFIPSCGSLSHFRAL